LLLNNKIQILRGYVQTVSGNISFENSIFAIHFIHLTGIITKTSYLITDLDFIAFKLYKDLIMYAFCSNAVYFQFYRKRSLVRMATFAYTYLLSYS